MAQLALGDGPTSLATSYRPSHTLSGKLPPGLGQPRWRAGPIPGPGPAPSTGWQNQRSGFQSHGLTSTGKGILIGMLSAFGSAALVGIIIAIVYFFRYTGRGRILLDRMSRPGEYDDEQAFLREEEEAMDEMDDMQKAEYLRAKAFVQANPPESLQTDISLSQFLAIQEKGVSAWEFEPELEIANCFVEARTEIEFFDSECSVQSNLPIPKQNEVYYWEAKLYDKPESTLLSIGLTTKPYPLFRLPGLHKYSIAYTSTGQRRYNQPFNGTNYAPPFVQGDVVGVGYRPRTGTVFFTRNGKRLEDVAHGLKSQNFFPTVGANGPANVHINFGQMGFVFIEANVKKWGLAPQTGSLAPPPPYGSEQGSILLEGGREGVREGQGYVPGHGRSSSAQIRLSRGPPARSPGPQRSPTDISLSQLNIYESQENLIEDDAGEGTSEAQHGTEEDDASEIEVEDSNAPPDHEDHPPPDYESPDDQDYDEDESTPRASEHHDERSRLIGNHEDDPPIPTYEAATEDREGRGRRPKVLKHQIPAHGLTPNTSIQNKPLLIYRSAFSPDTSASDIKKHLKAVGVVSPQWEFSMYPVSHFHTTSHEVLVIAHGEARLCFGHEDNPDRVEETVSQGDVVIIPAGVAHRLLEDLEGGFSMVGCYPKGCSWDMAYGEKGEEKQIEGIKSLEWFEKDPVYGDDGPAVEV